MTSATRRTAYREQLLDRVLPWWEENAVDPDGGVFTCFSNDGALVSQNKYTWSQGRWAWLSRELAESAELTLLDAELWNERARSTARHLELTLTANGSEVAFVTDRTGTHLPADESGAASVSVFADLFAVLGFTGAAAAADDTAAARWNAQAHLLLDSADRRVRDGSAKSAPYPVPTHFVDLGRTMLLINAATELHRRTGSEASRRVVESAVARITGPGGQWSEQRCWELRPRDSADEDTLLATHLNPGHVLEMAWMLLDAAAVAQTPVPDWLPGTVLRTLETGWDEQHGGILRFVDHDGGAPTGRLLGDSPYENLVVDTWDTKLWWVHIEALLACEMFALRTGDPAFDDWAERLADYTFTTFPDPAGGGEWLQIRDRAGAPLDRVVALPVKDPFHVPRALLRMLQLPRRDPMTTTTTPELHVHSDADALGRAAATEAGRIIRSALETRQTVRMMLAAAPSQSATLEWLLREPGIDWTRVEAFHMDDYIGLDADAPQGFGNWLMRRFFDQIDADTTFHRIDTANSPEEEAVRYGAVMGDDRFDLVLLGLGVNGHLAFNDPPAEFDGADRARVVELDLVSRQQQVDEGHFPDVDTVPSTAITVTIRRLLNADRIIASVPTAVKRQAVWDSLHQPIGPDHPGTALRTHPAVSLHVDRDSDPGTIR